MVIQKGHHLEDLFPHPPVVEFAAIVEHHFERLHRRLYGEVVQLPQKQLQIGVLLEESSEFLKRVFGKRNSPHLRHFQQLPNPTQIHGIFKG